MDILQNLTGLFPGVSPKVSSRHSDAKIQSICDSLRSVAVTAHPEHIKSAVGNLFQGIPDEGMDTEEVLRHVVDEITPGLAAGQSGPRYFGFVTGGALPAAQCGDMITTVFDQNVQVHLPNDSVSTAIEQRTLEMVLDILNIPREVFKGRSLTTGATASNILGLACGREYAVKRVLNDPEYSIADNGLPHGLRIRVITDRHHASIEKAAAIVGIGRRNVVNLSAAFNGPAVPFSERLDWTLQEHTNQGLKSAQRTAFIVVAGFAEVNTGDFTDMSGVKAVCEKYFAWLHIDAAFGALACLLPEYSHISKQMEDADSVTADAHKSFNAPYACGIFFTRSLATLTSLLAGSSIPAYLAGPSSQSMALTDPTDIWLSNIPSPLHTNLENSRRLTALPLYCALLSMGRKGYSDLMKRNVDFARALADWMSDGPGAQWYECLNMREITSPEGEGNALKVDGAAESRQAVPLNIVLFRVRESNGVPIAYRASHITTDLLKLPGEREESKRNEERMLSNARLIKDINATKRIYVSPGAYPGGAVRIAVSNWMTALNDGGVDLECVKEVLRGIITDNRSA